MDTIRICKQCLQPLPANAPEGLCPQCLAEVALGSESAASAPRIAPEIAQLAPHFPQLEILELLGMGGMGIVYKARQPRLDRLVALKILPVESEQHPSFAERFNREAKALAKLGHPGIVNVYDFGQTGQYYYFVMEYVDGMNLRQLLQSQTIEPRQALELVTQICTALQFAHDEGVVHRDIKPENILLNKKGQVKIADFGLAKLLGTAPDTALTMSQAAMGTLNYMAPEQRQNAQGVDHRADIYSLGVVFYEMLTGEVPMGRFEPPSKRVQVDVRLDEVVLRALEREPARRYQQASEIKSGVDAITSTGPEVSPTSPAATPEPEPKMVKPPRWFLQAFGLFTAGWLVTKMLWNFGNAGCWLACFGMAALAVWISLKRMQLFPVQRANWLKFPLYTRIFTCVHNIVFVALLCFTFLIGGIFNYWDGARIHGSYNLRSAEEYEAQYKGKEYHLLQVLPAFKKEMPTVEMVGGYNGYTGGWIFGWFAHAPGYHYNNTWPDLFFGCTSLFLFTYCLIGSCQFPPKTKKWVVSWCHIRASLGVCLAAFLSFFTLAVFIEMTYISAPKSGAAGRSYWCKTNIDTVTKAIETWTDQNGYALGDAMNWNLNTVPNGERVAQARLREAWKPSPFDRWHSTLTTFRRVSPLLSFELVASETPPETWVFVTGALDCTPEQATNGTVHQIPEDLLSMLDKMQSAPNQAHDDKAAGSTKNR
jgi:serine/threonine protein kinase